jgi:hypothetical protein
MEVEIYKNQGNQYRKTAFRLARRKLCQFLSENKQFYEDFRPSTDIPEGCPIPKNTYNVNYAPDGLNVPDFAEGKYMVEIKSYKGKSIGPSAKVYFEISRY